MSSRVVQVVVAVIAPLIASTVLAQECPSGCECPACTEVAVTITAPDERLERALAAFQRQDYKTAATIYAEVCTDDSAGGQAWFNYGYALHVSGEVEKALEVHKKASEFAAYRPVALYNVACAQALLGRAEEAFKALDASASAGFSRAGVAQEDADLDSLRADPRFEAAVNRFRENEEVARTRRRLDFWLGQWAFGLEDGSELGITRVTADVGGHLITETWSSPKYGSGRVTVWYDREADDWKALVASPTGIFTWTGDVGDGRASFAGNTAFGKAKMILKKESDDRLVETMYHDDGGQWREEWTVVYTRLSSSDPRYVNDAKPGAEAVVAH